MDPRDEVVLLLAGDVMTGRGIDQVQQHPGAARLHEGYLHDARDYVRLAEALNGPIPAPVSAQYIWGDALAEIERAAPDLRIVNLETAITRADSPWPGKRVHYRMNPANIGCLLSAGISACALANNHLLDWGRAGLRETLKALRRSGIGFAGAGADCEKAWAPASLPLPNGESRHQAGPGAPDGQLLLFSCATPSSGVPPDWSATPARSGIALLRELSAASARRLAEDILRRRSVRDLVVVSIHWGENWGLAVPEAHRDFAHRLIDAGAADVVHGHSSHHPLPLELYRGKLILYGCGDLINDYEGIGPRGALRSDVGCLYFATLDRGSGCLEALDVLPLELRRFRLVRADASAQDWLGDVYDAGAPALGEQPVRRGLQHWSWRRKRGA